VGDGGHPQLLLKSALFQLKASFDVFELRGGRPDFRLSLIEIQSPIISTY
jgi:hypothetical protein